MKTTMKISKLKKGIVTLCSALVITTGSYTQPNPDVYRNDEMASMIRLEALMNTTEQSIRFVAPLAEETETIASAEERLNLLADETEASLKYEAPLVELAETSPEMERLELYAAQIEQTLVFRAPAVEDTPEFDNATNHSAETMLADRTK
jgi:hypothetical protein